jgi:hypothetical protein
MSRFFILFIVLFSSLFAEQETYPFIGVTVSTDTVDLKPAVFTSKEGITFKTPTSERETTFGLQYGVQTKDYRTTFTAQGNSDFQAVDVEVDYILFDQMFGTPKIRPYVGATLGYIHYDEDLITHYNEPLIQKNEENDENTTISTSDGYYGLDFGFLFYITDNIDLDVGYHYYFMDRLEPLDTMNGATFSLHYFY